MSIPSLPGKPSGARGGVANGAQQQPAGKADDYLKETPPSGAYIRWLLANGDVSNDKSPLHYLGMTRFAAARGDHTHNGADSQYLFDPNTAITGDLSTQAGIRQALKAVMAQLAKMGLTDNTSN